MSTCVRFRLSLVVALWLILLVACGGSAAEPTSEAAAPEQATAALAEPTALPESAPADTPAPAAEQPTEPPPAAPTDAPADTPTDAPAEAPIAMPTEALPDDAPADARPLELVNYGFGVGELGAGWGLVARNPNTDYAVADSRYTLTVFDTAGNAIHSEEGSLMVLLPGQTTGAAGALLVGDEEAIAAIEVVLQTGRFVAASAGPDITAQNVMFMESTFVDGVGGMLVNPYKVDWAGLRVWAVAFDEAGNVIGGGTTILDLLPSMGSAVVAVPVEVSAKPARVELFAGPEELPE